MDHIAPLLDKQTDKWVPNRLTFCGVSITGLTDYIYPAISIMDGGYELCPACLASEEYGMFLLRTAEPGALEHEYNAEVYARLLDMTEKLKADTAYQEYRLNEVKGWPK